MSIEPTAVAAELAAPGPVPGAARARTTVIAAALAASAVAAAVNLLARPLPADDAESLAAIQPVRDAVWVFAVIGGVAFTVVYLTLGIAVCLLTPARGAALATIGAVGTGVGGIMFGAGFMTLGVLDYYLTNDEVPGEAGAAMFAYARDNAVQAFGIQAAGFGLSFVGLVLLAVALWRARSVPRWLPVAIPVAFVVMVVIGGSGVVFDLLHAVFMATLVAVAWCLWRGRLPGRHIPSSV